MSAAKIKSFQKKGITLLIEPELVPSYLETLFLGNVETDITVQDLLDGMVNSLSADGLEVGKDFGISEDPETCRIFQLKLSPAAYLRALTVYSEAAWKHCLPFIKKVS